MANFVYSNMNGKNDPFVGKFEHRIKALIEAESNACEKRKTVLDALFNIEKSKHNSETTMGQTAFGRFTATAEGQSGELDNVGRTFHKTIEHIPYRKDFSITREMMDDAQFGMGADMKRLPKEFTRAYYKTKADIACLALMNGRNTSVQVDKENVDLTTGDGLALFSASHPYYKRSGTQSNLFRGDICSTAAKLELALAVLDNRMRNFEDENGDPMEYTGNVLIIPSNRPLLEVKAKQVIGTPRNEGSEYINTQSGNWSLVVLPGWRTASDQFMIMSDDANRQLGANMFYNRVKLDIANEIETKTRNFNWNGYCRFGVGFTTWKHILLAVDSAATGNGNVGTAVPELAYAT